MGFPKSRLILGLEASYGKQKSEEMMNSIIRSVGLEIKDEYTKNEASILSDYMVASDNRLIKCIGSSIKVKILLMKED